MGGFDMNPPAVFHRASQGRVSLPWEAKALDGLELQGSSEDTHRYKFNFSLSSISAIEKICNSVGYLGEMRLNGQFEVTKWAEDCD